MGLLFPWCLVVLGVLSAYVSHVVSTPVSWAVVPASSYHRESSSDEPCCVQGQHRISLWAVLSCPAHLIGQWSVEPSGIACIRVAFRLR